MRAYGFEAALWLFSYAELVIIRRALLKRQQRLYQEMRRTQHRIAILRRGITRPRNQINYSNAGHLVTADATLEWRGLAGLAAGPPPKTPEKEPAGGNRRAFSRHVKTSENAPIK